jgi:DNA mismatch repair ATPase MutS
MIKDFLNQIKYSLPQITFNRKKKINERLKESFGKIKDDSFDFDMIEKYFRNKNNSDAHQVLSDKTCNDLDFDDLFMLLDRTNSKVGQQYLYNKLRTIQLDEQQTKLNEDIISKLSSDPELRISFQKTIENLKHKDAYYIATLFQEEHLEPPKWFFVIKLLSFTSLVSIVLSFFYPLFIILLIGVFCVNFVLHYWNKNNLVQYVSSIPQLLKLNNVASHLFENSLLKELNPDLPKSIKIINEVKNRMSFFQLEAKLQGDFEIIAWFLFELFKTFFLLEPLLLFGVLRRLNTNRKEIEDVFKFVGHIDMLISIASKKRIRYLLFT